MDFSPNVAAEQEINSGSNELGQQSRRKSFIWITTIDRQKATTENV